jgi:hypothetical protein
VQISDLPATDLYRIRNHAALNPAIDRKAILRRNRDVSTYLRVRFAISLTDARELTRAIFISVDTRVCPKCKRLLPAEAFARDKHKLSGRACWCKADKKLVLAEWRKAHPEKVREYSRKSNQTERAKAYQRAYHQRRMQRLRKEPHQESPND